MEDYLNRNRLWQSQSLQDSIASANVVLGGVGGLGWQIGSALIGLGIQNIYIFDPDPLEKVNLNRLWGCTPSDIGQSKVEVFKRLALNINPNLNIHAHNESVPCQEFETVVKKADVVFGAYDQPEPRLATQVLTRQFKKIFIDSGVGLKMSNSAFKGFGQVFYDSSKPASPCIICCGLRQDSAGYHHVDGGPLPSSGVLNGVVSNLAVSKWIQHLQNDSLPSMTRFNWNTRHIEQSNNIEPHPQCPVCGDDPGWSYNVYSQPLGHLSLEKNIKSNS